MNRPLLLCLILSLVVLRCNAVPAPARQLRVLFVGNSLTAANDLPAMVRAISLLPGRRPVECRALTVGGYSLEDHWKAGEFQRIMAAERFDFVVLQQGPSSLLESRANLRQWAPKFADLCRQKRAKTAFYMVWPEERRLQFMGQVADSYRLAAKDVGGILLPVGEAWMAAWRRDPRVPLYSGDRFHPSEVGSLLAALVIYQGLTGDDHVRIPPGFPINGPNRKARTVGVAHAATLNAAAREVYARRAPELSPESMPPRRGAKRT